MSKPASVEVNSKAMQNELKRLSKNLDSARKGEVDRGVARVLNRNAQKSKTLIVRNAASQLDIKQKYIRPRILINRAASNRLSAKVWAGTKKYTALSVGAKSAETGYAVGPYRWEKAFKWRSKQGKDVLLQRKGKRQNPLTHVGLGEIYVNRELKKATDTAVNRVMKNDFRADLHRELNYRLSKFLRPV